MNAKACLKGGNRRVSLHSAETASEVRAMVDAGADVNARSIKGTPLHVAKSAEVAEDVVRALAEANANVNGKYGNG